MFPSIIVETRRPQAPKPPFLNRLVHILTGHVLGTIGQIQHILLLIAIHTMLDAVKAKPKFILQIFWRAKFLLEPFVCWSRCAMFASPDFDIAHSPCHGLQCPTSFDWVGWQSCNVLLGSKTISLYKCSMTHNMLQVNERGINYNKNRTKKVSKGFQCKFQETSPKDTTTFLIAQDFHVGFGCLHLFRFKSSLD